MMRSCSSNNRTRNKTGKTELAHFEIRHVPIVVPIPCCYGASRTGTLVRLQNLQSCSGVAPHGSYVHLETWPPFEEAAVNDPHDLLLLQGMIAVIAGTSTGPIQRAGTHSSSVRRRRACRSETWTAMDGTRRRQFRGAGAARFSLALEAWLAAVPDPGRAGRAGRASRAGRSTGLGITACGRLV